MQTALAAGVTDNLTAGVPGEGSVAGARDVPRLLVALPFVAGISLATFLFAYLVSRFIHEAIEAAATPGAGRLAVFAPGLLAVITALGGLRWTVLFTLSFAAFQRARQTARRAPSTWPLVSIFVPAYNEAENIEAAIESLLLLDYPRYEVIVVDDGSTDGTCGRAKRYAGSHGRCAIRVYRKPNGGKWSAHNFAFRRAIGELVLCLDADSRVNPLSLRRMVVHMADPQVAAVAGQIRVRNRHNVLTRLQAMEYLMGDIAAVVRGLRDAGASEIIVLDGHGSQAFVPHLMEPGAKYITCQPGAKHPSDRPQPAGWPLDESIAGVIQLAAHAMMGTPNAVLHHTQSSRSENRYWYNGVESGELVQVAVWAGHFGVPTIMVTGDDAACSEANKFFGTSCVTVEVKKGLGREAAMLYPFAETRKALYEGAKRAVDAIPNCKPYRIELPIKAKKQYLVFEGPENKPRLETKEGTIESALDIFKF